MHIIIDAVGNKHSGGAQVLQEVVGAALASEEVCAVTLLASPASLRAFALPASAKLTVCEILTAESILGRLRWAWSGLDDFCAKTRHDVFLGLNGSGPVRSSRPSLLLVQQSLPYEPEALRRCSLINRIRLKVIRHLNRRAGLGSQHIMVQSEPMRRAICAAFGYPAAQVSVHMPSAPHFAAKGGISPQLGQLRMASGPVLLYVGNTSIYKNLDLLAAAMTQPQLMNVHWFATLQSFHPYCTSGCARPLGILNSRELYEAYRLATVLVMPSLTETVGLPMLEAMRAGTPVLAADRAYAHAVCEDAALFFDPHSVEDLISKARRLIDDSALRAELIAKGKSLIERRDQEDVYGGMIRKVVSIAAEIKG